MVPKNQRKTTVVFICRTSMCNPFGGYDRPLVILWYVHDFALALSPPFLPHFCFLSCRFFNIFAGFFWGGGGVPPSLSLEQSSFSSTPLGRFFSSVSHYSNSFLSSLPGPLFLPSYHTPTYSPPPQKKLFIKWCYVQYICTAFFFLISYI